MKISEIIASLIPKVRAVGPSKGVPGIEKVNGIHSKPDEVKLSGDAQLLNRLTVELKKMPEIDEAKVTELKTKIENGEYSPDAKKVAAKILGAESE